MEYELENVKGFLHQKGYEVISPDYYDNIYTWIDWYKGYVHEFHNFTMYNGFKFVDKKLASLKMAKRVSEEWASLLYNDNVAITCGNQDEDGTAGSEQEQLEEILERNKFNYKVAELIERTFALGTGALVEYRDEEGKARIDYVIAPMIFPLKEENGEITECAFGSVKNGIYYVNIHTKENNRYKIENYFYKRMDKGYQLIQNNKVNEVYYTDVKQFQIIKPNIANNVDLFTPLGLSVFANCIETIKTIDTTFDSFKNEFGLGKKRIFVKHDALTTKTIVNEHGDAVNVPIFDENQTEFFAMPGDEGQPPINEMNPTLRVTEHIQALETQLNMLSDSCGLGADRFSFKEGNVYTNTSQIVSTQSKLYKNILNHEKVLRYAITDMIKAVLYIENNAEFDGDITIDFDDSIVEDKEAMRNQALLELNNGLIDQVQYYVDVYKMTEEQAIEFRDAVIKRGLEVQKMQQEAQMEMQKEMGMIPEPGQEGEEPIEPNGSNEPIEPKQEDSIEEQE